MDRLVVAVIGVLWAGCVFGGDSSGDDDGASGCSLSADACTGDTICLTTGGMIAGGSCAFAFPRVYTFLGFRLVVPTTKPDGSPWDVGGGAPDPFLTMTVNGTTVGTSAMVADTFNATFPGVSFNTLVPAGASLSFRAFDEDATVDDNIFECTAAPFTAEQARSRHLQCSTAGYSLTFDLEVVHD